MTWSTTAQGLNTSSPPSVMSRKTLYSAIISRKRLWRKRLHTGRSNNASTICEVAGAKDEAPVPVATHVHATSNPAAAPPISEKTDTQSRVSQRQRSAHAFHTLYFAGMDAVREAFSHDKRLPTPNGSHGTASTATPVGVQSHGHDREETRVRRRIARKPVGRAAVKAGRCTASSGIGVDAAATATVVKRCCGKTAETDDGGAFDSKCDLSALLGGFGVASLVVAGVTLVVVVLLTLHG